jgi:hypothetical protein
MIKRQGMPSIEGSNLSLTPLGVLLPVVANLWVALCVSVHLGAPTFLCKILLQSSLHGLQNRCSTTELSRQSVVRKLVAKLNLS